MTGVGMNLPEPPAWVARALCAQTDPELFYPEKGGSARDAVRICGGCEVREECLHYALETDERWGIWGGVTATQRLKLRRAAGLPPRPRPRVTHCPRSHRLTDENTYIHPATGSRQCRICLADKRAARAAA